MATDIKLADDDGFFKIEFQGASCVLDLYEAANEFALIAKTNRGEDSPNVANKELCDFFEKQGIPRPSVRAALKMQDAIFARIEELKKKDSPEPPPSASTSSAGSTGSGAAIPEGQAVATSC